MAVNKIYICSMSNHFKSFLFLFVLALIVTSCTFGKKIKTGEMALTVSSMQ